MKPLDILLETARKARRRIVLSEGEDTRIAAAAVRARAEGLAETILVGRLAAVTERLAEHGADPAEFTIADPATHPDRERYAEAYHDLRKHKGVTAEAAAEAVRNPLNFAAMMVRQDEADGTIGGAVATTADTVRAALQVLGRAPGVTTVSSFFIMMLCEEHHSRKGALVFADCGLVVEPTVDELVDIAALSAASFRDLIGETPRVAMLSFSTSGSARHARVDRVVEATARLRSAYPDMKIDGDVQFDAAFVPSVSALKVTDSATKGTANVMIFPSLEAANIGYKIAQRIGGATAIGPVLQGLAKPANDLSRGCSAEDAYLMIAVTAAQAAALPSP